MSAVMVTGISGAGKSSRRRARGLASIDADNDPSLAFQAQLGVETRLDWTN